MRPQSQSDGYDKTSLGGWAPVSGQRLWSLQVPLPGDFNVPPPLLHNDQFLVSTESNGTRKHTFQSDGRTDSKPAAANRKLRPDMSTGVIVNDRLYRVNGFLYCLDLRRDLHEL